MDNIEIFRPVQSNNSVNSYMKGTDITIRALKKIKDLFGGEIDIEEQDLLEYLNDVIYEFSKSSRDATGWRWSKKKNIIRLNSGQNEYDLPTDLQSIVSVKLMSNCGLNGTNRPVDLFKADSLEEQNVRHYNSYSIIGSKITINNTDTEIMLDRCNKCCKCRYCNLYSGDIQITYLSDFSELCSLDSNITFLPNEMSIKKYLIEKLVEDILTIRLGQPYTSPKTAMYYRDVVQYDEKLFIPQKMSNRSSVLSFGNMMKL